MKSKISYCIYRKCSFCYKVLSYKQMNSLSHGSTNLPIIWRWIWILILPICILLWKTRNKTKLLIIKAIRVCCLSLISQICFLISLKIRAIRLITMDNFSLEARNKDIKKWACRSMRIGIIRLSKEEELYIFSQRLNLKEGSWWAMVN